MRVQCTLCILMGSIKSTFIIPCFLCIKPDICHDVMIAKANFLHLPYSNNHPKII